MKRIVSLFLGMYMCFSVAIAGGLSNWDLSNFIGVWEITPSYSSDDVSWVVDGMRSPYDQSGSVHLIELALDSNGHGYLNYYTESFIGHIIICGTIFTSSESRDANEILYFLTEKVEETGIKGIKPIRVLNGNNGPADPLIDVFIKSIDHNHYARFCKISSEYPNASVNQISSLSILIKFQKEGISIIDADNSEVVVYDLDGVLYYHSKDYTGETISLPKGNHYVVKVDDEAMKIAL